jgi:hypothetical protein
MQKADRSFLSPHPQLINLFERRSAVAANDGAAIAAHQGVGDFLVAGRAVKRGTLGIFDISHWFALTHGWRNFRLRSVERQSTGRIRGEGRQLCATQLNEGQT